MLTLIYNEDCFVTMSRLNRCVDIVLTSPPYNTSKKTMTKKSMDNYDCRYDEYSDFKTSQEYIDWTIKLFNSYDSILKENGIVLYNISYGTNVTSGNVDSFGLTWVLIAEIIKRTNFTVADMIAWKKKSALPNNTSSNKCTRIVEPVFVFCRKNEVKTFKANKRVKSISRTGQKFYDVMYNYIEAQNNDGANKLNKATFSSNLVYKLLNMYATKDSVVYDSFMGTGTTAVGCVKYGCKYIGSELSKEQCEYAEQRIKTQSVFVPSSLI